MSKTQGKIRLLDSYTPAHLADLVSIGAMSLHNNTGARVTVHNETSTLRDECDYTWDGRHWNKEK